jgi:capsular exopolysaccharide synthesis family protein
MAAIYDRRIKTIDDAEATYGLPVIAAIPHHRDHDTVNGLPWRASEEGFRLLHSQLGFLGRESGIKTVLVTSAQVGDGKTTVCAGLGYAAASAGQRVVCLDCDLRRPVLPTYLDCDPSAPGLIDALLGQESVTSVLADVPLPDSDAHARPFSQLPGSLKLLPAGRVVPNPGEFIAGGPLRAAIAGLAEDPGIDLLVVDSPPLTAVADAAILAEMCDAVVVVIRRNHSGSHVAKTVMATLERTSTSVVGLVVVDVRSPSDRYGYYYYAAPHAGNHNGSAGPRIPLPGRLRRGDTVKHR